ncbi:MAG TPA: YmaF family protein [Bacillota bacterium]
MDNNNYNDPYGMGHVHAYSLAVHPQNGHSHLAMGLTGPALPIPGGHFHQLAGYVSRKDGHIHSYSLSTSPAMQIAGASERHVHYFRGETSHNDGHHHEMEAYLMPE